MHAAKSPLIKEILFFERSKVFGQQKNRPTAYGD